MRDVLAIRMASKVAWQFLGKPYIWAGDDPMRGFDCSGYVIEILKSVGKLPRTGDWTAHDLFTTMTDNIIRPIEGCLVFWRGVRGSRVIHVEYCLNGTYSIGASGGGGSTMTERDAIEQNAYIKVRPFRTRTHIAGFRDPFRVYETGVSS